MTTTPPRCPVCHRPPALMLDAGWYRLWPCGRHLGAARSLTGIGLVARGRRDAGDVLFEMGRA